MLIHRCWLILEDPVRVLVLYASRRGACLPDFIVFLNDCSLNWSLFSVLRLLSGSCHGRRNATLSRRFSLRYTSLFFLHRSISSLRLVDIGSILFKRFPAVCQTNSLSLIQQVMVNQIRCILRLKQLTLAPTRARVSIANTRVVRFICTFGKLSLRLYLFASYVDYFAQGSL